MSKTELENHTQQANHSEASENTDTSKPVEAEGTGGTKITRGDYPPTPQYRYNNDGVIERYRTNLKHGNAKGTVYAEVTAEFKNGDSIKISKPDDAADISNKHIAQTVWDLFEETINEGHRRGYAMAGDEKQ